MKRLLGLVLILLAIAGGLYIGGYLLFFKGIIDIIIGIQASINAVQIATGICKIVIGVPIVEFIAWTALGIGLIFLTD